MLELNRQQRLVVLTTCCLSLLIVGLDNTIVNVALPVLKSDLHASVSGLQWTIDAYTLVLATLLMLAGSTGDRLGRQRVFQTGLVVFSLGSLLCSLAPGLGWLIAFRMVQAVGGSMLNPVAMSIITNVFTNPKERAQAIGVWGATMGISMALGPIVGGALVDSIGWRSIFWINVPVGVLAVILTRRYVPESRAEHPRRIDPLGQAFVLIFMFALTYAIIEGPRRGWTSALILGCFAAAAAALACLIPYELRRTEPLIDPRFFRSVPFSSATVIAVCAFAASAGCLFMNTLYLQQVRGYSPLQAGLATVPLAVMSMLWAPISGRLVGHRGTRLPLVAAGVMITVAGALLLRLTNTTPLWYLIIAYLALGTGLGLVNTPITNTAVGGMPRAQAGVAAAIASTSRQFGQTLGVAIVGSAVVSGITGVFAETFAQASHVGWWIVAGCGVIVFVLGLIASSERAAATAEAVRERMSAQRIGVAVRRSFGSAT